MVTPIQTDHSKILRLIRRPGLSFLLAIIGFALVGIASTTIKLRGEPRLKIMLVVTTLACLIWSIGLLSGVFSFRGTPSAGRVASRIAALAGIVVNMLLILCGVAAIFFVSRKAQMDIRDTSLQPTDRVITGVQKAKIKSASVAFQQYNSNIISNFNAVARPYTNTSILNFADVSDIADLQDRESLVETYIAADKQLENYLRTAPELFKSMLESNGIDASLRQALAAQEFDSRWKKSQKEILTLRSNDLKRTYVYLHVLKFLETNWDDWVWQEKSPHIQFDDEDLADDYNDYIEQINTLLRAEEESKAKLEQLISTNRVIRTNALPVK